MIPETDCLYVRSAGDGARICVIKSVDGTTITSFCVHECEGSSRGGSRSRRFILTGHSSGGTTVLLQLRIQLWVKEFNRTTLSAVQMWDLSTALDMVKAKGKSSSDGPAKTREVGSTASLGGPTTEDLVNMLHHCDLSNSHAPTPCCLSPSSSTFLNSSTSASTNNSQSQQTTRVVINPSIT